MDGEETMSPEDKFAAFGSFDPEAHDAEARARWGAQPAYAESARRTKRYTRDDWTTMRAEAEATTAQLAALMAAGVAATDARATALAEEHRLHIDRWFYPCSYEIHVGLGAAYTDDPRFAAHYERVREGLARYLRDAIEANARSR
jgi:hypothetical protein